MACQPAMCLWKYLKWWMNSWRVGAYWKDWRVNQPDRSRQQQEGAIYALQLFHHLPRSLALLGVWRVNQSDRSRQQQQGAIPNNFSTTCQGGKSLALLWMFNQCSSSGDTTWQLLSEAEPQVVRWEHLASLINMCQWCQCKFWPPKRIIKFDQHVPTCAQMASKVGNQATYQTLVTLSLHSDGLKLNIQPAFQVWRNKKHLPVKYEKQVPAIKKKKISNCCFECQ